MMTIYLNGDGTTFLNHLIQFNIKPDIFEDDTIKRAMTDIEHVTKIEGLAFYSYDFGVKSPENLSNGMKALILFAALKENTNGNILISNACMGANCATYLQELSLQYDFSIAWDTFLDLVDDQLLLAKDDETGTVFHRGEEVTNFYFGRTGVFD